MARPEARSVSMTDSSTSATYQMSVDSQDGWAITEISGMGKRLLIQLPSRNDHPEL